MLSSAISFEFFQLSYLIGILYNQISAFLFSEISIENSSIPSGILGDRMRIEYLSSYLHLYCLQALISVAFSVLFPDIVK